MEKDLYYQIPDKPIPNRSTLLRFIATDKYLFKNESLIIIIIIIIPN